MLDRLADQRQRREVQRRRRTAVERGGDRGGVEQVGLDERRALGHRRAVAAVERVEHGDVVAAGDQLLGDDRADVAGSAGDEEAHEAEERNRQAAAITSISTSQSAESVCTTIAVVGTTRPPSAAVRAGAVDLRVRRRRGGSS